MVSKVSSLPGVLAFADPRTTPDVEAERKAFNASETAPTSIPTLVRVACPRDSVLPLSSFLIEEVSYDVYDTFRLTQGLFEVGREITREKALPLESNMDLLNGVSFHKGCYLGQELTARTHYRGEVRKRILPVYVVGRSASVKSSTSLLEPAHALFPDYVQDLPGIDANGNYSIVLNHPIVADVNGHTKEVGKWVGGSAGNVGAALLRLESLTSDFYHNSLDMHFLPSGTPSAELEKLRIVPVQPMWWKKLHEK